MSRNSGVPSSTDVRDIVTPNRHLSDITVSLSVGVCVRQQSHRYGSPKELFSHKQRSVIWAF